MPWTHVASGGLAKAMTFERASTSRTVNPTIPGMVVSGSVSQNDALVQRQGLRCIVPP